MNFQQALFITLVIYWTGVAVATPEATFPRSRQQVAEILPGLLQDLTSEDFKVREKATQAIWQIGEAALPELQEAEKSPDPEQAYRARGLIQKIEFRITPETDPAVLDMVERYAKGNTNQKISLLEQLRKKRAFHQLLKLFAGETNAEVQSRVQESAKKVAVDAARESLVKGDSNGARAFLEMAPADAEGLIALASFHQSQGSLETELERAKTLKGRAGSAWGIALYRVKGDLTAARDVARDAGEARLSATMAALLGNPVPWMELQGAGDPKGEYSPIHPPYTGLAIRRWQGKKLRPIDLEPLVRSVNSGDSDERGLGINSLFLLGESALAEKAYVKNFPQQACVFYQALERIPEALSALGLDPTRPDYAAWVDQRFRLIAADKLEGDFEDSAHLPELLKFASFFESRGLDETHPEVFAKPFAKLAESDSRKFLKLLGMFMYSQSSGSELSGAPVIARKAASAWAGDQMDRWDDAIDASFGGREEILALWNWLAELQPALAPSERFHTMSILCGLEGDPQAIREKWLRVAWASIEATPEDKRSSALGSMLFLVSVNPDSALSLRLWDHLSSDKSDEFSWRMRIYDLSAAGRWNDAAQYFLDQIELISKNKVPPSPYHHACAAACLRKAGKLPEAALQDSIVEKLALGRDLLEIASGYAFGCDFARATAWWQKASQLLDPASDEFRVSLKLLSDSLIAQGRWLELASISEISAQMAAEIRSNSLSPLLQIRHRIHSDLGRALAKLKTDREKSIELLDQARQICPNDASMADDFYPSLRKAGLVQELEAWFDQTWPAIIAVTERFPLGENTFNSAGWLASRAQRNLEQAENLLKRALAKRPHQPAYLDTMAEIQFGLGRREKAIDWSAKAINFAPLDTAIRRQHERFRSEPLPR